MYSDFYEPVIGLEIHAQLLTKSKLFCSCPASFGGADNENTCPVCTGQPGALPVLNKRALELGAKMGLALNCRVNPRSTFARKNYFYPDLPKGYQISQYDQPVCEQGYIEFLFEGKIRKVGITRAHLEEDAGKSIHSSDGTMVDLNRSSVPLLEIVSEPEIRSAAEAAAYGRAMRAVLQYAGVCDGNLEEGSMRCDCNVSIRKRGDAKFGTKVELKNINSFRFIEKAIEYEIQRQIDVIEGGGKIVQETRLYDSDKNRTFSMRTKEDAHDYRYFPDPDLTEVEISQLQIDAIKKQLPELPIARFQRFQESFGLPAYDADLLIQSRELADYFEEAAATCGNYKSVSNWIMVEIMRELNDRKLTVDRAPVSAKNLGQLIKLIDAGKISGKIAKTVFQEMCETGSDPESVIKAKGLVQVSDSSAIEAWVDQVVSANASQVEQYRQGKEKVFGFFVGQVMKLSKGQANPDLVNSLLIKRLKG